MGRIGRIVRGGMLALTLVATGACTAIYRNHGYVPAEEDLSLLEVGRDTRDTVGDFIGRPSSSGVLDRGGWYYVGSRWRTWGPTRPEEIDRQVVAISFNQAGVVTNIERFGLERGQVVPLSRRVTDSNIQGVSFIRQLLGNIGNLGPLQSMEDQ